MQFMVLGWDGTDEAAAARRDTARPVHLARMAELRESGQLILGTALLDDDRIVGSLLILEAKSRAQVDDYLASEPLNTTSVWERLVVQQCRVGDAYMERLRG